MEKRDMSGVLFKNNRKEKETHPDFTGKIMVGGAEYYLSAWKKQGAVGRDNFLSLAVKPVVEKAAAPTSNDNDIFA